MSEKISDEVKLLYELKGQLNSDMKTIFNELKELNAGQSEIKKEMAAMHVNCENHAGRIKYIEQNGVPKMTKMQINLNSLVNAILLLFEGLKAIFWA